MNHDWLKKFRGADAEEKELSDSFMKRLRNYRAPKRFAYQVLHFLINNT